METYYYFFVFGVIVLLGIAFTSRKVAAILFAIILILFAGTRGNVDNDYFLYKFFFEYGVYSFDYFRTNFPSLELSIFVIPSVLSSVFYLTQDIVNGSFLMFAIIAVGLKVYSIYKYSNYFILSCIFYFSSLYFMHELTTIRAGVSAGLLLLSIGDFEKRKHFAFILKFLVALLFHYSSVLILLCYLLVINIDKIKYYYYGIFASIVCAILKINILKLLLLDRVFPKVDIYLRMQEITNENKVNVFNFKILFSLLLLIIFWLQYKKLLKIEYFKVLYKLHIISLIVFFMLSPTAIVFSLRSFELLSIIQVLLAPMILFAFQPKFRYLGVIIVITFSIIQLYYIISIQDIFRPYSSWLF